MGQFRQYSTREQSFGASVQLFQLISQGKLFDDPKISVACIDTVAGGVLSVAPGHPEMFGAEDGPETLDKYVSEPEKMESAVQVALDNYPKGDAAKGKFGAIDPKWWKYIQNALQMLLMLLRNS